MDALNAQTLISSCKGALLNQTGNLEQQYLSLWLSCDSTYCTACIIGVKHTVQINKSVTGSSNQLQHQLLISQFEGKSSLTTKCLKVLLFYQLRLLTQHFKELRDLMILYSLFPFQFQSCTIPIHLKCDVFLPSFCLAPNLSLKIFPLFFILPCYSEMVMEICDISSKTRIL